MRDPQEKRNLLDLVFTSNATLTKSSTNIPGISDHAIIITDMDTKPYYQKTSQEKATYYGEKKICKK
jgi:hypothetical protein